MVGTPLGFTYRHWRFPCVPGGMIYLLSKADETSKRTKAMVKELEQKGITISRESKLRT